MKYFSKKTETILTCIFLLALFVSSLLILYSNSLMYLIQTFLETKVYHRTFDIAKWADTIIALIAFPVTAVIFCAALIFVKLRDRTKLVFIGSFTAFIVFFIGFCSFTKGNEFINSDSASEILLAKECFLKKNFWPRSWNYSTEFRLLNTQLITTPLFFFTSNWHIVKMVSAVILTLILPLSLWFLLSKLSIRSLWLKSLCCLLVFCPTSLTTWDVIQFGNYYIPHIAMEFVYLGLFFGIAYSENPFRRAKTAKILFFILSFICGLSSIRYILQFQLPLAAVVCSYTAMIFFMEKKSFHFKKIFIEDTPVFYSCIGLILGGIGYILNSVILSNLYSFSDYNNIAFNILGEISFIKLFSDIAMIFGYKNEVSVMTPAGIVNVLFYVFLVFFLICTFVFLKKKKMSVRKIFITFCVVMILFNGFVYVNTDYYARYFTILFACIPACIAIYIDETTVSVIKKYLLGISFTCLSLIASFITFEDVLIRTEPNKKNAAEFLAKSPYTFGYATFWNANVFSYLTDGKTEIACLDRTEKDRLPEKFVCEKWLTPDRYYDKKENISPVFLLVSEYEYTSSPQHPLFSNGKLVYADECYRIFEFTSDIQFKNSF